MPSGTNTPKLNLTRIQEDWKFGDESFNRFIDDADNKLVGVAHLESPMHWTEWTEQTLYYKDDVVRYPNLHSHQYARCLQDGTSDIKANIPTNNVTGSIIVDGTTKWEVCSLTQVDADNGTIRIWLSGAYYHRGDAVRYGDALYRAKIDHEADVTFDLDENKWQEIYASIRFWKPNIYYYLNDTAIYDDIIYKCIRAHKSVSNFETVGSTTGDEDDWEIIGGAGGAKDWQSDTKYQLGQLVLVHGILYRCNLKHRSSNSFSADIANWDLVDAQIHDWQTGQYYVAGTLVAYNNIIYKCLTSHTASANFETDISNWILYHNTISIWDRNKSYYQGQIVIYSGTTNDFRIYRCNTTHVSPYEIVENEGTENEITRDATFLDDIANWDILDASIALWKKNTVYKIGDIVLYNNEPFRCVKNHTSGNINTSTIFDDITDNISTNCWEYIGTKNSYIFPWQANTHYNVNQYSTYNGTLYKCNTLHTSGVSFDTTNWDLVYANIQPWTTGIIYKIDSIVLQDGHLYVCNTTHTAFTFSSDRANWDEVGGGASIPNWQSGIPYNVNDVVLENGILYRNNAVHTSDTTFADDISYWDIIYANIPLWYANTYYPLGTMVIFNNRLYKCIIAHTSSSSFIADSAKWQLIYGYDIKHEVEGYELTRGMNVKVTEDKLLVANDLLKDIRATNDTNELGLMGVKELTNSEIFNSWITFTCNPAGGYWNDPTNTDQAAAKESYSFNTTYDAIICSRNNDAFSAFISQETYAPSFTADYTIDNRILAQIDPALCGDDDGLFFILGFMQDANGDYHTLSVIRNGDSEAQSGPGHGTRFAIAYDLFTSWINSAGSTMKLLASNNTLTTHSWDANSYAKLQVTKTSTTITAKTSEINSDSFAVTLTYTLPATKPSDMTQEQYNNIKYMLEHDTKIGFGTESNCSAFRLSLATGSINGISVYNTNTIQKVYFEDGVQKSVTADTTTLLPEEFVYSRLNKKLFYVKDNKEAYEIKLNTLCEPWESNTLYVLNSLVYYNGSMYKCKQAHISFNMTTDMATNWDKINGDTKIETWATSTNYSVGQLVLYGDTLYRCNTAHLSDTFSNDNVKWDIVYANIQKWTTGTYYKQNSAVINGNKLYVCLTAHTATTFDSDISNWLKIGGRTDIENWAANTVYKVGEIVLYDNVLYKCNTDNTSSSSFLTDVTKWDLIYANIRNYANNTIYKQGSIVIYNNKLYRCTQTHTSNTDNITSYVAYYSDSTYVIDAGYGYGHDGKNPPRVGVTDLGAVYDITRLTGLQSGGYSGITYLPIDVSIDGTTYTNFATYENPNAREGTTVDVSGYARGRYIRFTLNSIRRVSEYIDNYGIGLQYVSVYAQQPYWELIADADTYIENWQTSITYEVNRVVVYGNKLYRCLTEHQSSTFVNDSANWELLGGNTDIEDWAVNTSYRVGEVVEYDGVLYRCNTANTSSSSFLTDVSKWDFVYSNIKTYVNNAVYKAGSEVVYDGGIWRSKVDHTSINYPNIDNYVFYSSGTTSSFIYTHDEGPDLPKSVVLTMSGVGNIRRMTLQINTSNNDGCKISDFEVFGSTDNSTYISIYHYIDTTPDKPAGGVVPIDISCNCFAQYLKFTVNSTYDFSAQWGGATSSLSNLVVYTTNPNWELIAIDKNTAENIVNNKIATKAQVDALFI